MNVTTTQLNKIFELLLKYVDEETAKKLLPQIESILNEDQLL